MWQHAHRLTGARSTAEDVLTATFVTAWRRRSDARFVGGSALPWLLSVAGEEARPRRRGPAHRGGPVTELPLPPARRCRRRCATAPCAWCWTTWTSPPGPPPPMGALPQRRRGPAGRRRRGGGDPVGRPSRAAQQLADSPTTSSAPQPRPWRRPCPRTSCRPRSALRRSTTRWPAAPRPSCAAGAATTTHRRARGD
ncbi:hypothetical protein KDL28_20325 [Pseudonocardia sp. S2-4]|uniref:RNA polymerase sigma-70 region 2 domain-containing protein n=1 Tax=Pseudonocardia humida TaxID=2800819 RepID=A0ABT1A386_9PSEU|nr:hypothetical protein [Pseudonocardia humida]